MAKRFVSCRKKVQKQLWGDESYAKHFVSRWKKWTSEAIVCWW
jgi:hypothetical protein